MADHLGIRKNSSKTSGSEQCERRVHPIKQLSAHIIELINHFLYTAETGLLLLTVQDGNIVKVERTEKFIINKNREASYIKYGKPAALHPLHARVISELQKIQYGHIIVRFTNGKFEEIEKTEKQRLSELEGVHGDGI